MVSSRHNRSSAAAASSPASSEATNNPPPSKIHKPALEEWTTREKLYLASLAIKHGNAWNSVARNMTNFLDKDRPEGWSNQRTCAAQFDKLMNELGVDKRPKRNDPTGGNSSTVIYKKVAAKRIKELEDNIVEMRKLWLGIKNELDAQESDSSKQKTTTSTATTETAAKPKASIGAKTGPGRPSAASTKTDPDKPPTRALTRRESSRQNLEKTLSQLCKDASEIKQINLFCKPAQEADRELYDKIILKHVDMSTIKKRLGSEVDDPYAVLNDLLLMFQNAIMFYPQSHPTYEAACELRARLVPQWEKALLAGVRSKH